MNTNSLKPDPHTIPLYMYFSLEGAKCFLQSHSLKLSNPIQCNDPFECQINKESDIVKDNRITYGEHVILYQTRKELGKNKIGCFTTKPNNILMWAHYAQYNKGVCIEFDPRLDTIVFDVNLYYVKYENDFAQIDDKHGKYDTYDVMLTKSPLWDYEEEIRLIKERRDNRFIELNPLAIRSIILGCQSENFDLGDKDRIKSLKKIIALLKRKENEHITIKQIQLSDDSFDMFVADATFVFWKGCRKYKIISLHDQKLRISQQTNEGYKIVKQQDMHKWDEVLVSLTKGNYFIESSLYPSCIHLDID